MRANTLQGRSECGIRLEKVDLGGGNYIGIKVLQS